MVRCHPSNKRASLGSSGDSNPTPPQEFRIGSIEQLKHTAMSRPRVASNEMERRLFSSLEGEKLTEKDELSVGLPVTEDPTFDRRHSLRDSVDELSLEIENELRREQGQPPK